MSTVLEKIYFSIIVPGTGLDSLWIQMVKNYFHPTNYWQGTLTLYLLLGSLLVLMAVMSYYFAYERSVRTHLDTNLEQKLAENHQNNQTFNICSEEYHRLKNKFNENMKTIRIIEPQKKKLEESIKICREELKHIWSYRNGKVLLHWYYVLHDIW